MRVTAADARSVSEHPRLAVGALFAAAVERAGLVERSYEIAGQAVTCRFAGEEMVRVGRALDHLRTPATRAGLTIDIWDSESTGGATPPLLGEQLSTEDGPMYYYERDGVQALNRWRTLSVLDAESAEAWFWAPEPDAILSWDRAAPLRAILHWWLGRQGILQLHGGAVGTVDGGVLLVGRGGSGKSTTSLACLTAGLRYAGDDYVAVAPGPEPWVHSLYSSGKLEDHQLARFPGLAGAVGNPGREAGEKAVVYVEEAAPGAAIAGFPLRAILVPRVVAESPETRAVPRPAGATLAALAPSTIFQLYPPQQGALADMGALVGRVPCFTLELGSDVERIPDAVFELLEALR
jgi:hypothetical protein